MYLLSLLQKLIPDRIFVFCYNFDESVVIDFPLFLNFLVAKISLKNYIFQNRRKY